MVHRQQCIRTPPPTIPRPAGPRPVSTSKATLGQSTPSARARSTGSLRRLPGQPVHLLEGLALTLRHRGGRPTSSCSLGTRAFEETFNPASDQGAHFREGGDGLAGRWSLGERALSR